MQVDAVVGLRQRGIPGLAYEVPDHVLDGNRRLAPPTASRAQAGLIERGDLHHLGLPGSFFARGCERRRHVPILSIREERGVLGEAVSPQSTGELSSIAGLSGIVPARQVFEVRGLPARCGSDEAAA